MIELILTSFPLLFRIVYLRFRKKAITVYNIHRAVFVWFLLFLALVFTIEYYHPETHSGIVPFRIVPVVAENGGTVTSLHVKAGQDVEPGDLLFTVDDSSEAAAVGVAESQVEQAREQITVARSQVREARAAVDSAQAALDIANVQLSNQEKLREEKSPAFALDRYLRAQDDQKERTAAVAQAQANLETASLQADKLAPTALATAEASLGQAQVELDKTRIKASVAGRIEQLTLNVGDRAAEVAINPAMVIVPHRTADDPAEIVAGFTQVNRSVIRIGMPAEVACASNINNGMHDSVLPARIVRIQESIATGQIVPTGKLLQPSERMGRGEVVVHLKLEHPEHQSLLVNGSRCLVQAYTTRISGSLADTALGEIIEAWALEKAIIMRMKVWVMLATGAGLGGAG
ncbi:HlyD family secretion protein [Pukyongiella litopenaei]|uniref:HlyD family secretion protein n=1 Tax=Pukyongiella litopenaei TaxID=2605946 RepID=A0A2S0MM12_9RHOB|nr:biotin/lipoyl-binding protein [Pukyongiella litopenaei]AVO36919.1 HlyD family secretion protein [Pukyongiella litopenaei]